MDQKTTPVVTWTTNGQRVRSSRRTHAGKGINLKAANSEVIVPKQEAISPKAAVETKPSQNNSLCAVTVKQLKALNFKEVPTLLTPFFPKVGVAALVGSSDTGKSSLLRQLAYAIASKKSEFLGFPLNAPLGKVVYVSTEDNDQAMSALFNRLPSDSNTDENADENLSYVFETSGLALNLDNYLQDHPVDCVIVVS